MTEPTATPSTSKDQGSYVALVPKSVELASDSRKKEPARSPAMLSEQPKKYQRCRFFASKRGCLSGEQCPYLHDVASLKSPTLEQMSSQRTAESRSLAASSSFPSPPAEAHPALSSAPHRLPPLGRPTVDSRQVVPRPVPKAASQDPRGFQISQLKRRFHAKEESKPNGLTELEFDMPPSDPDFPFEIDNLKCIIKVSAYFPMKPPALRVTNREMERGYQVNVERGFDLIWRQSADPSLLRAMKELDKKLEQLLMAQKTDIIKIVAPMRAPVPTENQDLPQEPNFTQQSNIDSRQENKTATRQLGLISMVDPTHERKQRAQKKRDTEVHIMEHRMSRDPHFARLGDGTIFTLPIQPRKREALPVSLQSLRLIQLFVPSLYDIESCTIKLMGVEGEEVDNVQRAFLKHAREASNSTLLSQVNYLASNIHIMAIEPTEQQVASRNQAAEHQTFAKVDAPKLNPDILDTDKSHVKIIPRPPEWCESKEETESNAEDGSSSFSDTTSEADGNAPNDSENDQSSSITRERGIMLSFPSLTLHNVELLELQSVHIAVKCDRCKDVTSFSKICNNIFADPPQTRLERCKKCAAPFSLGYRRDIIHENSIRAGYLDLEGCSPFDLLPSPFLPTCSLCSITHVPVSAVRGDAAMAICRECHAKLSFTIKETKFLRISASVPLSVGTLPRKKPKDMLGIVTGTELPRSGRCRHYAKSHRWFRFSCCDKIYPCDKCHDAEEKDHVQEFANRMICGFCSREQNYRPEECGFCRRVLTGKRGHGFWEGGKGTRDPKRMSRKDPRKYKRRGTGAVKNNLKEKYET